MSPTWVKYKSSIRLEGLSRFAEGDDRDYSSISPIKLLFRFWITFERLRRLATRKSSIIFLEEIGWRRDSTWLFKRIENKGIFKAPVCF